MRRLFTFVKALGSLALLTALLVGVPALLLTFAGSPLPDHVLTLPEISHALFSPDDGTVFLSILAVVGWIAWATFAIATLLELPAAFSTWHAPRILGLGLQRRAAQGLLTAIIIGFALPSTALAAESTNADPVDVAHSQTTATTTATSPSSVLPDAPVEEPTSVDHDYTVVPGDTLWDIADQQLGDPYRWPEIRDLNAGALQPDGFALTGDGDWIVPGWTLTLPADQIASATPPTEASAPAEEPATEAPTAKTPTADSRTDLQAGPIDEADSAAMSASSTPSSSTTATEAGASQTPASDQADETSPWYEQSSTRTAGGIASALGFSLLSLLVLRRRRLQHDRPLGLRLPSPEPADSLLETQLRRVADPIEMDAVDAALRSLAEQVDELPDIRVARMNQDMLEVYLHAPASLPAPWEGTADHMVWSIHAAALAEAPDRTAPYPSLVTLGVDEDGAQLLIDLEHVRSLDMRGAGEQTASALAALALELATSPWADDLQVTLVGLLPELPDAIDTGRIRYVTGVDKIIKELEVRARTLASIPNEADPIGKIRSHNLDDSWTPEILLIPSTIDEAAAQKLDELVQMIPRIGVAMVTETGHNSQWALTFNDDTATLEPAGITVAPQRLTPTEYAQILALLDENTTFQPGPSWAAHLPELREPTLEEASAAYQAPEALDDEPEETTGPVDTPEAPSSAPEHSDAPTGDLELDAEPVPAVRVPEPLKKLPVTIPTTVDTHLPDIDEHTLPPVLRVLGDVTLEDAGGVAPKATHQQKPLEVIAYLALHPAGAPRDVLDMTVWGGAEVKDVTRNSVVSRARKWLGTDDEGEYYLPHLEGGNEGGQHWTIQGVETDWDRFQSLIGPDVTTTPLKNLTRALDLVTGEPLRGSGSPRQRLTKFAWADGMRQDMISTISDVAHAAAINAFAKGHALIAHHCASKALLATKDDERIWRDILTAAATLNRHDEVRTHITTLTDHFEDLGIDLEDETLALIDALTTPRAIAANE